MRNNQYLQLNLSINFIIILIAHIIILKKHIKKYFIIFIYNYITCITNCY